MPRPKRLKSIYYRIVAAPTKEDAEQEGLAQVLEAILPDTMDEWRVAVKQVRPLPKDETLMWDVRVDFNRVRHPELGKPVEDNG